MMASLERIACQAAGIQWQALSGFNSLCCTPEVS